MRTITGVCAVQLLFPAKRGFDQPVRHSVAITNDEVIADAQPGATGLVGSLAMHCVDRINVSATGGSVMKDNVRPLAKRFLGSQRQRKRINRRQFLWLGRSD